MLTVNGELSPVLEVVQGNILEVGCLSWLHSNTLRGVNMLVDHYRPTCLRACTAEWRHRPAREGAQECEMHAWEWRTGGGGEQPSG